MSDGLCQCGCGQPTGVSNENDASRGRVKGQPYRYVLGHARRVDPSRRAEHLWRRIDVGEPDDCWEFIGALQSEGYGQIMVSRRRYSAHRLAYELVNGPIPEGLTLDHLCRNRACCNPAHLEVVDHRENTLRGQGITAKQSVKTHCVRGHAFDEANTYWLPSGGRACKECRRLATRRHRQKASAG